MSGLKTSQLDDRSALLQKRPLPCVKPPPPQFQQPRCTRAPVPKLVLGIHGSFDGPGLGTLRCVPLCGVSTLLGRLGVRHIGASSWLGRDTPRVTFRAVCRRGPWQFSGSEHLIERRCMAFGGRNNRTLKGESEEEFVAVPTSIYIFPTIPPPL